jgi:hypothetical protein
MSAREIDKVFKSSALKSNKKILEDATISVEEKVQSFEIICNLLGVECLLFDVVNLNTSQRIYPSLVNSAKDLQNLNSEELLLIERNLETSSINNEFQSCLILFLKINRMKLENKSKDEILAAKLNSAEMMKSNTNANLSSLRSLSDKMIQIGHLIQTISEKKRELKEIGEDEFLIPSVTRHQMLRLIPFFNTCYCSETLVSLIVDLFKKKNEIQ